MPLMDPLDIVSYQSQPDQWLRSVLEGNFLGQNPYIDQLISQIEQDAQRQFADSILPAQTAQLNQSGAYGTALGQMAQKGAAEDFARGLMGQTSGIRFEDYGAERDRMMEALGLQTGQTDTARGLLSNMRLGTEQSETARATARIAANARRHAANAAAGASRYGSRLAHQRGLLGLQNSAFGNLLDYSGLYNQNYQTGGLPGFGAPDQVPNAFNFNKGKLNFENPNLLGPGGSFPAGGGWGSF